MPPPTPVPIITPKTRRLRRRRRHWLPTGRNSRRRWRTVAAVAAGLRDRDPAAVCSARWSWHFSPAGSGRQGTGHANTHAAGLAQLRFHRGHQAGDGAQRSGIVIAGVGTRCRARIVPPGPGDDFDLLPPRSMPSLRCIILHVNLFSLARWPEGRRYNSLPCRCSSYTSRRISVTSSSNSMISSGRLALHSQITDQHHQRLHPFEMPHGFPTHGFIDVKQHPIQLGKPA